MKKIHLAIKICLIVALATSCKNENSQVKNPAVEDKNVNNSSQSENLWAEQVESSVSLTVPDDWSPEDWNTIFKNINRKKIYEDVIDAVLNGKQTSYDFFNDSALSIEQVNSILHRKKKVFVTDSVTNESKEKEVQIDITPETISLMRVRESVYFDKENFKLTRIPSALILYIDHYTENGSFVGYAPLFYVKLNN